MPNSELGRVPNLQDPIAERRKREGTTFDTSHALAQAIMDSWKKGSPVDCLVISPQFELMGRQPVNELRGSSSIPSYLTFLKDSLVGKQPGLNEDTDITTDWKTLLESGAIAVDGLNVVLTPKKPGQEVLSVFRTLETNPQNYTIVEIDTTVFKESGILTIDIWVGDAGVTGSFDLFAGNTTKLVSDDALASARSVPTNQREVIKHPFDQGQVFKLRAIGSSGEKGKINGFLAKISVEPVSAKNDGN